MGEEKAEHLADLYIAVEKYFKDMKEISLAAPIVWGEKVQALEVWAINNGYTRQELREMKSSYITHNGE